MSTDRYMQVIGLGVRKYIGSVRMEWKVGSAVDQGGQEKARIIRSVVACNGRQSLACFHYIPDVGCPQQVCTPPSSANTSVQVLIAQRRKKELTLDHLRHRLNEADNHHARAENNAASCRDGFPTSRTELDVAQRRQDVSQGARRRCSN